MYGDNRIEFKEKIKKDYFVQKKCTVEEVINGVVVPAPARDKYDYPQGFGKREGGCVDAKGEYIASSARRLLRYDMNYVEQLNMTGVPYVDETVCYLGPVAGYWGHILTEISCCLYYAINHRNMKWVYWDYTDPHVETIREPLMQFLELLGICKEQLIAVTKPTRFQKIIVPEVSAVTGEYYTDTFKSMYDYIRDVAINSCCIQNNKVKQYKKIYLTKTEFESSKNNQIGEESIKHIFEENGYTCVSPEKMDVISQIKLFSETEEIVAVEGTLPHNILFCKDGIKLTIINRKSGVNTYQLMINQMKNAEVTYIDSWYMLLPIYSTGPYIFSVNHNIEKYVKDRKFRVKRKDRKYQEEYYKLFWYILQYLDIYDLQDKGKQLEKVWEKDCVRDYLISRKEMQFWDVEDSKKIRNKLKELLYKSANGITLSEEDE